MNFRIQLHSTNTKVSKNSRRFTDDESIPDDDATKQFWWNKIEVCTSSDSSKSVQDSLLFRLFLSVQPSVSTLWSYSSLASVWLWVCVHWDTWILGVYSYWRQNIALSFCADYFVLFFTLLLSKFNCIGIVHGLASAKYEYHVQHIYCCCNRMENLIFLVHCNKFAFLEDSKCIVFVSMAFVKTDNINDIFMGILWSCETGTIVHSIEIHLVFFFLSLLLIFFHDAFKGIELCALLIRGTWLG